VIDSIFKFLQKFGMIFVNIKTSFNVQLATSQTTCSDFSHLRLQILFEYFSAGQGICHGYHYQRGQTGGWHDVWCEHLFKVGSKMQACQERRARPIIFY
jgi:hypothetical protein